MFLIEFKARITNYNVVLRVFHSRCWVFKCPFYKWRDEEATFKSLQITCVPPWTTYLSCVAFNFLLTAEQRTRQQLLSHVFQH